MRCNGVFMLRSHVRIWPPFSMCMQMYCLNFWGQYLSLLIAPVSYQILCAYLYALSNKYTSVILLLAVFFQSRKCNILILYRHYGEEVIKDNSNAELWQSTCPVSLIRTAPNHTCFMLPVVLHISQHCFGVSCRVLEILAVERSAFSSI